MQNNINLLYLIQSFNMGGAENLVFLLGKHFRDTDINPIVCALEDKGPLKKSLDDCGVKYFCLNKRDGIDLITPFKLSNLIRKENINILHAHNLGPFLYGFCGTRFNRSVKFVYTEHVRLTQEIGDSAKLMKAVGYMVGSVDVFVSIAEHISEYMNKEFAVASNKIVNIPNGVDLSRFLPEMKTAAKISPTGYRQGPVIGNIAALRDQKNQVTLIEAMPKVVSKIPDARLVIVGTGPLDKTLKTRVNELNLNNNILFLGHRTDIPELLHSFDVFVLPSLYEGLPLCLLESMAAGTPVIATDVYGNNEIIKHNETGFLVPPRDPESMANAITELLGNVRDMQRFANAGRQLVEEKYDLRKVCDNYRALYRSIENGKYQ